MDTNKQKLTKRNLFIFSILVLAIAVVAGLIDPFTVPPGAEPGTSGLGQLIWLIAPLVVMLLLRILGGDGWNDFGIRPNFKGNGFWWLVSILVFPGVVLATILFGSLFGGLKLDTNMTAVFTAALLPAFISAAVKNIFEECAWRGYLAPKVYSLNLNPWVSHALVGLVWGLWHLPFIFVFWSYLTPKMLWYFVPLLLLGTISQSVVYGEIRLATDSVWPAWLMHTIGNTLGNALLLSGFIQLRNGTEIWSTPGAEGVVSIVLFIVIGYVLHQRRNKARKGEI